MPQRWPGRQCPNCDRQSINAGTSDFFECQHCDYTDHPSTLTTATEHLRQVAASSSVKLGMIVAVLALSAFIASSSGVIGDGTGFPVTANESGTDGTLTTTASTTEHGTTQTPIETTAESVAAENGLNQTKIENLVHERINEIRQKRGLEPVSFDVQLRKIARYHSEDMGKRGYFAHESPDGKDFVDRYSKFGYDCRVEVNETTYAKGSENIALTHAFTSIRTSWGENRYLRSNEEVATTIVDQWMHSSGHRENILKPYWNAEGIGIYVVDDDTDGVKIYATQNFC